MPSLSAAIDDLARDPSEAAMANLAARADDATEDDLARLTEVLADSGERIAPVSADRVDIASSGGPGSLSTLIAPLYARALGAAVSKIAVPGRPAGGIDVLASLAGYRADPGRAEARDLLEASGYVHVRAGQTFCPLDARFFAWRQANGMQAAPALAITSLLSKKLAAGVGRVLLDIRFGPQGNFGADDVQARLNARRFIAVADRLGIEATCVLLDATAPAQPLIGRGEALVAIDRVLADEAVGRLRQHADRCLQMAELVTGVRARDRHALTRAAGEAHQTMLAMHGVPPSAFRDRVAEITAAPRRSVRIERAGHLMMGLGRVRDVLVARQRAARQPAGAAYADPCGLELLIDIGSAVRAGAIVASVRDEVDPDDLAERLALHFDATDAPPGDGDVDMEVVR